MQTQNLPVLLRFLFVIATLAITHVIRICQPRASPHVALLHPLHANLHPLRNRAVLHRPLALFRVSRTLERSEERILADEERRNVRKVVRVMRQRGPRVRSVGDGQREQIRDSAACLGQRCAVEAAGVGVQRCGFLAGVEAEEAALHALARGKIH